MERKKAHSPAREKKFTNQKELGITNEVQQRHQGLEKVETKTD